MLNWHASLCHCFHLITWGRVCNLAEDSPWPWVKRVLENSHYENSSEYLQSDRKFPIIFHPMTKYHRACYYVSLVSPVHPDRHELMYIMREHYLFIYDTSVMVRSCRYFQRQHCPPFMISYKIENQLHFFFMHAQIYIGRYMKVLCVTWERHEEKSENFVIDK